MTPNALAMSANGQICESGCRLREEMQLGMSEEEERDKKCIHGKFTYLTVSQSILVGPENRDAVCPLWGLEIGNETGNETIKYLGTLLKYLR